MPGWWCGAKAPLSPTPRGSEAGPSTGLGSCLASAIAPERVDILIEHEHDLLEMIAIEANQRQAFCRPVGRVPIPALQPLWPAPLDRLFKLAVGILERCRRDQQVFDLLPMRLDRDRGMPSRFSVASRRIGRQ